MGFSPIDVTDRCRAWLTAAVGPCSVGVPYAPATTATVLPVQTEFARFVLKWFTWDRFVAEDPDRVPHEVEGLELARAAGVRAPAVVAADPDGSATGHPAMLMTEVPGASLPRPSDWSRRAAEVAARLHAVQAESSYRHFPFVPRPFTPRWASDLGLWDDAVGAVAELEEADEAVIHRDLHRWNMHWHGGELAGVVDWLSVCRGPIGEDVGRVWVNEVLEGQPREGEAFRTAYVARAGRYWDPRWELQSAIDMLPAYEGEDAVEAWGTPVRRARLEDCLRIGLSRI